MILSWILGKCAHPTVHSVVITNDLLMAKNSLCVCIKRDTESFSLGFLRNKEFLSSLVDNKYMGKTYRRSLYFMVIIGSMGASLCTLGFSHGIAITQGIEGY